MKEDMGVADEMALLVLGSRACEARQNALICSLWWLEVIDCNKTACRTTWVLPIKWGCWFWDRARAARVIAREARQIAIICSLLWLEVMD